MTPRYPGCVPGWEQLESDQAKRLRGKGWSSFARLVKKERGERCQICGTSQNRQISSRTHLELHVHHILKVRTHRHLRFERSNVAVVCQDCHDKAEAGGFSEDFLRGLAR